MTRAPAAQDEGVRVVTGIVAAAIAVVLASVKAEGARLACLTCCSP